MNTNRIVVSLRPVAGAVLGLGLLMIGDQAIAGEDDIPLSLTLAQYLSHDNNFAKDDNYKVAETTSTTVLSGAFNKSYGRQNYQLSGKLSAQRYKNYDQLNNDGKDVNASFSSELLRNWLISANGAYSEALNTIQNNAVSDRLTRNIKKYRDGGFSVQYGNGGTWAVAGSYDQNRQVYSADSLKYQNSNQTSKGLRAIYNASDLLSYSMGFRHVITDFPNNATYSQIADRNIDITANWQVTGVSGLNATLTRRSTSYTPSDIAGNTGWTGLANWYYTPHGILTYNIGFSRTTGTDRSKQGLGQGLYNDVNNNTTTTSLSGGVNAQVTGKITVGLSASATSFKIQNTTVLRDSFGNSLPENSPLTASYNHVAAVSVNYNPIRSVGLGCSYQRYSQGQDAYRLKYTGNSIDCNASFTLNPL